MLNRGVNGNEAADMLARLDTAVIAEKPISSCGRSARTRCCRDQTVQPHAPLLHEGLARMKAIGADVVLIDPQYAPRDRASRGQGMVSLIATAAKAEHVCLFHRFELMRQWRETEQPAVRDVRLDGRIAHERLELRLRREVARPQRSPRPPLVRPRPPSDRTPRRPTDRTGGGKQRRRASYRPAVVLLWRGSYGL